MPQRCQIDRLGIVVRGEIKCVPHATDIGCSSATVDCLALAVPDHDQQDQADDNGERVEN